MNCLFVVKNRTATATMCGACCVLRVCVKNRTNWLGGARYEQHLYEKSYKTGRFRGERRMFV